MRASVRLAVCLYAAWTDYERGFDTAASKRRAFDNPDWLFELKYDDYRVLLYIEAGRARFPALPGGHRAHTAQ